MKDFRKLEVWHKAHQLTLEVYRVTKAFPSDERFGVTSQTRRICSRKRCGGLWRRQQLRLSALLANRNGTGIEVEYHLLLSRDLAYFGEAEHVPLHNEAIRVKKMLSALLEKIDRDRAIAASVAS